MKTLSLISVILVGLVAGCASFGVNEPKAVTRTEVVFDHPEKFTDVKDSSIPTDQGRDSILSNIREYMIRCTSPLVPDGYWLKVVFTDIDLAGDFEPWHGPQWNDVRIIKAVYPPAFSFTYTVTDPAGKVVKQGSENIRDMMFNTRLLIDTSDSLRFEKAVLEDWARGTLRDLKKT